MAVPAQDNAMMRKQFFSQRRQEAQQAPIAQGQEAQDAIQRRFTSMGAANSGAAIAAAQKARDSVASQQRIATQDVDQAELQSNIHNDQLDKQMGESRRMFDVEQGNKLKQLDLAEKQFLLDKDTTEFNKRMAEIAAGQAPPEGMFDKIGSGLGKIPGAALNIGGALTGGAIAGPLGIIPGAKIGGDVGKAVGGLIGGGGK